MEHVDDLLLKIYSITTKIPRLGLIIISTSKTDLISLIGRRLYDGLNPEAYEFKPYNATELYEILKARIIEAYNKKEIIQDKAMHRLAEFVAENGGNVRQLFSIFLDGVDLAQQRMNEKSGC
ncbi:hypothetical protein KEJ36_01825 [Candidatus Bathyarchaeota archaeon]|nr:hypothetical protein [Candidatus Bathyarchaeota archaeon]MBS7627549.1 hypothetical protein [Candidatus Bathyarchaeota archaeon]